MDSRNGKRLKPAKKPTERDRLGGKQIQSAICKAGGGLNQMTPGEIQRIRGLLNERGLRREVWI